MAQPLTSLLKGSVKRHKSGDLAREWGLDHQSAFDHLIRSFQEAPLLQHYDPKLKSRIETDVSNAALGAIYSQLFEDNQWHPAAFFSRQFQGPELRYATSDKEMLAIVAAFKHWRHYLQGSEHSIEV